MADKYCQHHLYAESASFTASLSGTTLTVSAVSSGRLNIGSIISGAGLTSQYPLFVTALGTGTGLTGTYTVSHNYNGTVASSSMTSTGALPLTVPVWGVAQDGDGAAIGAATPATASVSFTGVPSSGSIAVLGVTLSVSWATSADNCANLLANAINASTATATGPGSFTTKSQVRNHIYARGPANGAPAGTCQIMTRQGAAAHNGLIAVTHTLNNVSSSGTITFSGAQSGAWGWLASSSVMWPSGLASGAYGLFCPTRFCGTLDGGDVVHIRRGARVYVAAYSTLDMTLPACGSASSRVTFRIDEGVKWSSDSAEDYVLFARYQNGATSANIGFVGSANLQYVDVQGARRSADDYSLRFYEVEGIGRVGCTQGSYHVIGADFQSKDRTWTGGSAGAMSGANDGWKMTRCRFKRQQQSQPLTDIFVTAPSGASRCHLILTDCVFDTGAPTAPQQGEINWLTNNNYPNTLELNGCKFVGYLPGSKLFGGTVSYANVGRAVLMRNCDLGNISVIGPNFVSVAGGPEGRRGVQNGVYMTSQVGGQDFLIDSPYGMAAWLSNRSFPTLDGRLRDGVTPWSLQIVPSTVLGNLSHNRPFETPRFTKINTLPTGVRTITVEFGIEQALAWSAGDVSIAVEYEDANGVVCIDSLDVTGGALTPSTAAWTNAAGSQFTYSDSGDIYFNKFKISLTTPTAILGADAPDGIEREIGVVFRVHRSVSDTTKMLFVDPDFKVV